MDPFQRENRVKWEDARMLASPLLGSTHSAASSISAGSSYSPLMPSTNMFEGARSHSSASSYSRPPGHALRTSVHLQMPEWEDESDGEGSGGEVKVDHPRVSASSVSVLSLFQRRRTRIDPSSPGTSKLPPVQTQSRRNNKNGKQKMETLPQTPMWSPISTTTKTSPASSVSSRIFSPITSTTKTLKHKRDDSRSIKVEKKVRRRLPSPRVLAILLTACLGMLYWISQRQSTLNSPISAAENIHDSLAGVTDALNPDQTSDRQIRPDLNTLALYRIIGNDLPPRHAPNQTLNNLRFLLANEHSDFIPAIDAVNRIRSAQTPALAASHITRIEKYFILNRLTAPSHIANVRAVLKEFGVTDSQILEIPFEWEEYALRSMRWDGGVADVTNVWGIGRVPEDADGLTLVEQDVTNRTMSAVEAMDVLPAQRNKRRKKAENIGRLRAIDFTYHDKNLYAINNNGGRNFALNHGRQLGHARWILPLDGNCFFTPAAMVSLIASFDGHGEGAGHKRHVTIPMARLLDNKVLLPNNTVDSIAANNPDVEPWRPTAPEEPQVGFRFDSGENFQEEMRYGRRSKLEFLWRLGAVPRSRDLDKRTLPWERSDRDHLTGETFASIRTQVHDVFEAGFMSAGWTYRLFSGEPSMEINTPESNSLRNMNRIRGIVSHLERLDETVLNGQLCYRSDRSECGFSKDLTFSWDFRYLQEVRMEFRHGEGSDVINRVRALTSVSNELLARKVDDYGSDSEHALHDATALILASFLTDDHELGSRGARLIDRYLLGKTNETAILEMAKTFDASSIHDDGDCYLFPLILPAGISPPLWVQLLGHQDALAHLSYNPRTFQPAPLLDALRLLRLLPIEQLPEQSVEAVASLHLAWLVSDHSQLRLSHLPPSADDALEYDYQIAALAAFLGEVKLLSRVMNRGHLRYAARQLPVSLRAAFTNVRAMDGQFMPTFNDMLPPFQADL